MGSKRGRLLLRQNRIKRECDLGAAEPTAAEGGGGGDTPGNSAPADASPPTSGTITLVPVPRLMERQCSEPAPQTTSSCSSSAAASPQPGGGNLLSVPQPPFLIKQHSSPQLQIVSSSPITVQVVPGSETSLAARPKDELRRTASSPQCTASSEVSRSCHCPVQRPGPALGCNYCWNTIDAHGRILRRKTKYHCPECQTNLCIVPCFQEYHERHNNTGSNNKEVGQPSTTSTTILPTIMKTSSM